MTANSKSCTLIVCIILFLLVSNIKIYTQKHETPIVDVQAKGVLKNGEELPVAKIIVEEFLETKIFALLNYLFFDEGSSVIPARYKKLDIEDTKYYNPYIPVVYARILDVYYDVLNIIGYRLRENKQLRIILTGCNSNEGIEVENLDLSKNRALSVKKYLVDIWQISGDRIKIEYRNLPKEFSRSSDEKSIILSNEENRRVEINDTMDILKPLIINDTLVTSNPPFIYFYTDVKSRTPIRNWKLTIKQNNKDLRTPFRDNGHPYERIPWYINKNKNEIPRSEYPIFYQLFAHSKITGLSERKKLPVIQQTITTKKKMRYQSKEYSRYNLILFGFNSSKISNNHIKILKLIKEEEVNIDKSKFYISGYTDIIGNDETNKKLSYERASETARQLKKLDMKVDNVIIEGYGSARNPYLNSAVDRISVLDGEFIDPEENFKEIDTKNLLVYLKTPEGRFYCRTVVIEIEKSIDYNY
ncbi:OmpA family protein [Bacteroidota bacterium]